MSTQVRGGGIIDRRAAIRAYRENRCRSQSLVDFLDADLVKPETEVVMSYDDPLGVTAAFNKNLLIRLNRELDGDFDADTFDHHVVWNAEASGVESYLVSRAEQLVCLRGVGCCLELAEGEALWTESSHKYETDAFVEMGERAGFSLRQQWIEPASSFALTLFEA